MPKSTVFFWEGGGGFLTLGKVNGAKIDRFFFGEGGFLTFGKVNGAKIDRFFFWGGGRGVLDIREGQRCQNRPFFFFFFFGGGGVLDIREGQRCQNRPFFFGKKNKKKLNEKSVPKSTVFPGGGGGVQI